MPFLHSKPGMSAVKHGAMKAPTGISPITKPQGPDYSELCLLVQPPPTAAGKFTIPADTQTFYTQAQKATQISFGNTSQAESCLARLYQSGRLEAFAHR